MSTYIDAVAHGFVANDAIVFSTLEGGETIVEGQTYYVLAAGLTADAFQFSETVGGVAVSWTTDLTSGDVAPAPTYSVVTDGIMDPPTAPDAPGSCSLSSTAVLQPDGTVMARLDITITQPTSATLRHTVVTVTGGSAVEKVIIPKGQTTGSIVSVVPGVSYTGSAVAYDTFGLASTARVSAAHVAVGDITAPAQIVGEAAAGAIRGAFVTWTASAATDLSHYEVQRDTSGAFGAPLTYKVKANAISFAELATGTYYFRIRAVDLSGNAGTYSGTVSATSRLVTGGSDIVANSIVANDIAAGAITADRLSIGSRTAQASMVPNHSFEDSAAHATAGVAPSGWLAATSGTGLYYTESNPTAGTITDGAYAMVLYAQDNTSYSVVTSSRFGVNPGESLYGQVSLYSTATATGLVFFRFQWWKRDGTASATPSIDITAGGNTVAGVAQTLKGYVTVPSDATFASIQLWNYQPSSAAYLLYDSVVVKRPASGVQNSDGNVVIDANGITINNGKLVIKDRYAATAMTATGFAGSWLKFVKSRVYNNDFASGTLSSDAPVSQVGTGSTISDYDASLSSIIPYWVVSASDGTLTIETDSTASSGLALKSTCTAGAQTNCIYQDIPVTPGETPRIIRNLRIERTANDVAVNVYTSWRDANHAIIGSEFGGGLIYNATAAYWTASDYPISPLAAPANASYLRYRLEFVHNTGTGTSVFVSDVALKDTTYQSSAAASAGVTLTTSYQVLTGAQVIVSPGNYLVHGTIDFQMNAAGVGVLIGVLEVDGSAQPAQIIAQWPTATTRMTVSQSWIVTVAQGAAGVLRLVARKTINAGTVAANQQHTTIIAIPLP